LPGLIGRGVLTILTEKGVPVARLGDPGRQRVLTPRVNGKGYKKGREESREATCDVRGAFSEQRTLLR